MQEQDYFESQNDTQETSLVKIYILEGPEQGRSISLDKKSIILGRTSNNDIQVKDPAISGQHLKIVREKDHFFIEDLNSTNGTYLNGHRIVPGRLTRVNEGDLISLGNTLFCLDKEFTIGGTLVHRAMKFPGAKKTKQEVWLPKDRPMTVIKNLELIYNVSNALMESFDLHQILKRFMEAVFNCLKRIDRGAVLLFDPRTLELKEIIARTKNKQKGTKIRYSKTVVNRVLHEGKPVCMSDTSLESEIDISDSIRSMKIRSVMCVPLISRSQIRGVIYVDSLKEPHGFRKEDLHLLSALSSPAAIAIENALIYSELERMVENRTKSLRETERRLRESEARFRAIFDNMESAVVVYEVRGDGEDFIILDFNRAAQRIERLSKNQVKGKSVREIFPGYESLGLIGVFKKVWKTGDAEHIPPCFYDDGRTKGWREFDIHRLPSGELVTICNDITAKKQAEEEQQILQKKLMHSQKLESIGRLAGGVAHNFRNILQAILGNTEYIQMVRSEDQEIDEVVKNINNSIDKGVDLIQSLLHFSRLGEDYDQGILDLSEVIQDTYKIIERLFDKSIEIRLNVEEGLFIKGNKSLLSQVFMNLFTNARDAMPEGGILAINATKAEGKIIAKISDTGHGMDKKTLEKIFDPFFTSKEVGKGTGLGLSTVHGIVEEHRGTIVVSSKVGEGSTFTLTFPLAKEEAGDDEFRVQEKRLVYGNGEKILVVDDEEQSLDALVGMTERLGYEVKAVDKPMEAVKVYNGWRPQVVLMDRSMPGMDGISCTKEILKSDPGAKVIIISGYEESGPDGIEDSIRELICAYMTKPCRIEELSNTLAEVLKS